MKLTGIPYTDACEQGMKRAADELGIDAVFLGPATPGDSDQQVELIEKQIEARVDAIVISPNDPEAVKPAVERAKEAGIEVFTWDSDAPDTGRAFYVCAVDDIYVGIALLDRVAKEIGEEGKVAIISGGTSARNLNLHIRGIEGAARKYPDIQLLSPYIYNDEDQQKAVGGVVAALRTHPDVKAFISVNSPGVPGAARAVLQAGKEGKIRIWGISTPDENRDFIKKDIVHGLITWDPAKLTYLTARLVNDYLDGNEPYDGMEIEGIGKLRVTPNGTVMMHGVTITDENIDKYRF